MQNKVRSSHESKEGVAGVRREACEEECLNDSDHQRRSHRTRTRLAMSNNDRASSMFERYGAEF